MSEKVEHWFVGRCADRLWRRNRSFNIGFDLGGVCTAKDDHVPAKAGMPNDGLIQICLRQLLENRNFSGTGGLKMKVIRCRGAAAGAVVQSDQIGTNLLCQVEKCSDAAAEKLRPVLPIGDGAVQWQNRKRIRQKNKIFERDATFL